MPSYLPLALVSFGLISVFNVGVKRFQDKLCLLFWVNLLAYADAVAEGAEKLALVGVSCQSSSPPAMSARKAGKVSE